MKTVGTGLKYLGLIVVLVLAAVPIYWLLSTSVTSPEKIFQFQWFPDGLNWQNYIDGWKSAPFGAMYKNSIIVTLAGALIQICVAILSSYAFAFLDFPGKRIVFLIFLGAMMVPGTVVLMPNFLTIAALGWVNTYAGIVIPGVGSVFAMFLLRQHMLTLSSEVTDAAKVDGANHLRILWHVVLPMSRPMVVTVIVVALVEKWNDFVWPLVSTSTDSMRTLPVGLLMIKDAQGFTNWGAVMASSVFIVVPVLIVFFIAQRQIIAGLTAGATKG
ncbi:carbohydrate ABC transporter permease [Actinocatenispora comari]|jgi:multiple sugar transport system permease protein/sn-glycerol 3-phosphate transport system permease protein|uniref:Glycerol-3-phosphate ABC transporter permease n=1 Tax=Actinocatenispora comari TaxID=2807577 RepID=A0A8J4AG06_9ACTN|nr:carbohydrate ABC transporter permease [Actinocatenispora comari]GIL30599.1 glycerol-3-phosphate ABC transporter permease [Actinocatenispora comari]